MINNEELEKAADFLLRLLKTPSPTGYCDKAINLVLDELKPYNVKFKLMNKGGLLVTFFSFTKKLIFHTGLVFTFLVFLY